MAIKLVPLTKAFPKSGYDTNKERSHFFAHAGVEYLLAYEDLLKQEEASGHKFYVELPLLHMTLELLIKAHASLIDESFNPKQYRHQTKNILKDYADEINEFKLIIENPDKIALIEQLEEAWKYLRYGEMAFSCEGKDIHLAKNLAIELVETYHKKTRIPFFAHHFPTRP